MSYVLSVVCVRPAVEPVLPTGPLILREARQSPHRACYLPGLTRYFGHPIEGTCYYVFVDVGKRFPSSRPFFYEPRQGLESTRLAIGPEYRREFGDLLRALISASSLGRVLVLCELNGNVTWVDPAPQDLEGLIVRVLGPVTVEGFWDLEVAGEITEPSLTIIQEP